MIQECCWCSPLCVGTLGLQICPYMGKRYLCLFKNQVAVGGFHALITVLAQALSRDAAPVLSTHTAQEPRNCQALGEAPDSIFCCLALGGSS